MKPASTPESRLMHSIMALLMVLRRETMAIDRAGKTTDLLNDSVAEDTLWNAKNSLLFDDLPAVKETLRDAIGTLRGFRRTHNI